MAKKPARTQQKATPKARTRGATARPGSAKRRAPTARAAAKSRRAATPRKPARRKAARPRAAKPPVRRPAAKPPARRLPAKPPARRQAATKALKKTVKKTVRRATSVKASAPRAAAKTPPKAPVKMAKAAKPVTAAATAKATLAPKTPKAPARSPRPAPGLNRERRTVREAVVPSAPSSLVPSRHASAASSGADELRVKLASHTGTGPAITAGDVDANWESAEATGDEAPGGDNPTPDQDVVDEIGRALGVEYDDDEELQGGDEIAARDQDRWELDPASSDDFDER
jgi:Family of unknown function (DUF6335)